jgi:AcrR family transcriptional regulator
MTTPRPNSRAEQRRRTEARILDAATQVFFSAGYDRATIRAVASAAGVDAGLVMHYFGSKQELYRRVIDAAPVPELSGTPAEAAEQILAGVADRLTSAPVASLALLRSMLTNPEAASAASAGIARYEAQIHPGRRRRPAGRDHQRHHRRHHGLQAPHQDRRTRHRRSGARHQAAAPVHALANSPTSAGQRDRRVTTATQAPTAWRVNYYISHVLSCASRTRNYMSH